VTADQADTIGSECDQVDRGQAPPTPPPTPPSPPPTPGTPQPIAPLSITEARGLLPSILTRKYGSRFRKRKRGSYTRSCSRLTTEKVRCRVRWLYRVYKYSGTVTLRNDPEDPANSVVYRLSIKRTRR
jgi:hypothetical protein